MNSRVLRTNNNNSSSNTGAYLNSPRSSPVLSNSRSSTQRTNTRNLTNTMKKSNVATLDVLDLETSLGITLKSSNSLAISSSLSSSTNLIAYPAASTLVIYNPKKNSQQTFLSAASHYLTEYNEPTPDSRWKSASSNHMQPFGGIKSISCVNFSSDGKYVAFGEAGHQPKILVWDHGINNGGGRRLVADLAGHKFGITAIAFSPNIQHLVSVGYQHDGNIFIWDWRTGVKIASCRVSVKLNSISFDPTGQFFVTSGFRHVKFWSFSSVVGQKGTQLRSGTKMSSSIDGKYAIMGDNKNGTFMDIDCGVSLTGDILTYSITSDGVLVLFRSETRLLEKWVELKVRGGICISVCDKYVVCGCTDGIIRVFEPDSLKYVTTLPHPHAIGIDIGNSTADRPNVKGATYPNVISVKVDQFGHKITCVYADHSLYVWDFTDPKKIAKYRSFLYHSDGIWGIEMYPGSSLKTPSSPIPPNTFVTYSSDGTVRFWNLDNSTSVSPLVEKPTRFLGSNPYSKQLIKILYLDPAGLNNINLLSDSKGEEELDGENSRSHGIRSLKISTDGKWMASGDRVGGLWIHNLEKLEKVRFLEAHEAEVMAIDFSPSFFETDIEGPNFMATASRDRMIHVYDVDSDFRIVQTLDEHSSSITGLKFTTNDTENGHNLLSCAGDKSIIFRELVLNDSGTAYEYAPYHLATSRSTIYDMDVEVTHKLVASVAQDRRLNVFSVETGRPVQSYKASLDEHGQDNGGGGFIKISLDPSGLYAVTASSDKYIRLFDFYSGAVLCKMVAHSELITCVKFSLDGSRILSTGSDGCVFIWKLPGKIYQTIQARLAQLVEEGYLPRYRVPNGPLSVKTPGDGDDVDNESKREPYQPTTPSVSDAQKLAQRRTQSPGFSFRFSESGLPSWARSGYDPSQSIEVQPVKNTKPPAGGLWAERIGSEGIELFSELGDEKPVARPEAAYRRYSIEVSPVVAIGANAESTDKDNLVVEDIAEGTAGESENNQEKDDSDSKLKRDDSKSDEDDVVFFKDDANEEEQVLEESFVIQNDTHPLESFTPPPPQDIEKSQEEKDESVEQEKEDKDDDDNNEEEDKGMRRALGKKSFEEYIDQPIEYAPKSDSKTLTARHLEGKGILPSTDEHSTTEGISNIVNDKVDDGESDDINKVTSTDEHTTTEGISNIVNDKVDDIQSDEINKVTSTDEQSITEGVSTIVNDKVDDSQSDEINNVEEEEVVSSAIVAGTEENGTGEEEPSTDPTPDDDVGIVQEAEKLKAVSEEFTKRLVERINTSTVVSEDAKVEYEQVYKVMKQVHESTMQSITKLEEKLDKDGSLTTTTEVDINEVVKDGRLKMILETYSDILVSMYQAKVKK